MNLVNTIQDHREKLSEHGYHIENTKASLSRRDEMFLIYYKCKLTSVAAQTNGLVYSCGEITSTG